MLDQSLLKPNSLKQIEGEDDPAAIQKAILRKLRFSLKSYFDQVYKFRVRKSKCKSNEQLTNMVTEILQSDFEGAFQDESELKALSDSIIYVFVTKNRPQSLKYLSKPFSCVSKSDRQEMLEHPFTKLAKHLVSTNPDLQTLFYHKLINEGKLKDPADYKAKIDLILDTVADI